MNSAQSLGRVNDNIFMLFLKKIITLKIEEKYQEALRALEEILKIDIENPPTDPTKKQSTLIPNGKMTIMILSRSANLKLTLYYSRDGGTRKYCYYETEDSNS